ncbi:relaxase/mobilization nuclease domain-containing protein [Phenylobacterium sp.]|uniref:relaxase/mobilization nuclease domain-containing protein n=1 Tax=Phenylobacterium sp. TaxID=1871053 RepID=UPI003BAB34EA
MDARLMVQDEFELRPGRIRSRGAGGAKTFVGEALAAAQRAGGLHHRVPSRGSVFGRGRASSLSASRGLGPRARRVIVKARVVRQAPGRAPLSLHLKYLQREGVTQDGEKGALFDAGRELADGAAFAERGEGDRHHFRFIVSPEDAAQLADLKAFTRDLMGQAERDLGTRLDWVAVDHWNTGQPHIHIIVRGRDEAGDDLVISRDYIADGLRSRAAELVTLELGPRSDLEIRRGFEQQVGADRWTDLDRRLARDAGRDGLIDVRPPAGGATDELHAPKVARLRRLQLLGLAEEVRPGRWRLAADAEPCLRELGQRGDIIARLHRALGAQGIEPDPARFVVEGDGPIMGRLVGRGLDDELKASAYAVIDGIDGRIHHVALQDLADASDAAPGAIVEVRAVGERGRRILAVRSDLDVGAQVTAQGATWLDRQLVSHAAAGMGQGGFAAEVETALVDRAKHLIGEGLARRAGGRVIFIRDLLETLRVRELAAAAAGVAAETGLEHLRLQDGDTVSGVYRSRLNLASGRFAVIEGGLGFSLVPWRADLERQRGREVAGVMAVGGAVDWTLGRQRAPER